MNKKNLVEYCYPFLFFSLLWSSIYLYISGFDLTISNSDIPMKYEFYLFKKNPLLSAFTSGHLHRNIPHLCANIITLGICQALAYLFNIQWWKSFYVFYLSLIIINQLNSLIYVNSTVVGASGGLFGLIGFLFT